MTFREFHGKRKKTNAAEMERAGVTHSKHTQYGSPNPGDLLIESTGGREDDWAGMFCLIVEGREYFSDDQEQLERSVYERYSGGHVASTANADP